MLPGLAGPVTSDRVRAAAYRLDVPEGSEINGGGVRFSLAGSPQAGQNLRTASVVGQWQEVNRMVVVYPPAYADSAPRLGLSARPNE